MLDATEFGREYAGHRIVIGKPGLRLLNPFAYHKDTKPGKVYIVEAESIEAADGGYGHVVVGVVAARGTPEETAAWAEAAIAAHDAVV